MRHDMHVNIVNFLPGGRDFPCRGPMFMEHAPLCTGSKAVYLPEQGTGVEVEAWRL